MYRKLSIDESEVVKLYTNDMQSSHSIGRSLGISHMTVLKILKRNNEPRRSKKVALKIYATKIAGELNEAKII